MSLGISCNFYREVNALPSFLKMATSGYFDDVVMIHAPPEGAKPDDESIELVKAAGVRLVHTTINAGFGVVRTRCIRESRAEWVIILDCDEMLPMTAPVMRCEGEERYPHHKNPNLKVIIDEPAFDYGARLKHILAHETANVDAVCLTRRHWFDVPGGFTRPCENFSTIQDWQLRLLKNSPFLFYDPAFKMHEKILDSRTWAEPRFLRCNRPHDPWFSHHHCHFKPLEAAQNAEDAKIYEMLDKGVVADMWLNEAEGVKS